MHAGFQEGLSLTVHDEILRYCKYAYGCSEMMFNSVWEWPRKGVLSKLFITYIRLKSIPWCAVPHNLPLFPQYWWCNACPHMFCLNAEGQLVSSLHTTVYADLLGCRGLSTLQRTRQGSLRQTCRESAKPSLVK